MAPLKKEKVDRQQGWEVTDDEADGNEIVVVEDCLSCFQLSYIIDFVFVHLTYVTETAYCSEHF